MQFLNLSLDNKIYLLNIKIKLINKHAANKNLTTNLIKSKNNSIFKIANQENSSSTFKYILDNSTKQKFKMKILSFANQPLQLKKLCLDLESKLDHKSPSILLNNSSIFETEHYFKFSIYLNY
jgi:hypothetical protein